MSFGRRPPDRRPDRGPRRSDDFRPRDRGPRDGGDPRDRPRDRPFTPRRFDRPDDGGMSIRLDPRRLNTLKTLAGEAGLRPGELVLRWVEERIDGERRGERGAPPTAAVGISAGEVSDLRGRLEALAARVAALEANGTATDTAAADEAAVVVTPRRGPGRPRKAEETSRAARAARRAGPHIGLHDEIIAVITERGPLTAAELAAAISDRGRYAPPRSGRALDAATVNSRISNPAYRRLFRRQDGRIGLADVATADTAISADVAADVE